jgi:hypothetical protein
VRLLFPNIFSKKMDPLSLINEMNKRPSKVSVGKRKNSIDRPPPSLVTQVGTRPERKTENVLSQSISIVTGPPSKGNLN